MRKQIVLSAICCCMTFLCLHLNAQNTWTKKEDYPIQLNAAVGFSIGSKGYIATGWGAGISTDVMYEYDPTTDIWTQRASISGGIRSYAAAFSIGSKGYVGTGSDQNSSYSTNFYEYDPVTNSWTPRTNFPGAGRESAVGFSIGTKGYIGTGWNGSTKYKDFYAYDPSTNSWAPIADLPNGERAGAAAFSIGSKGYVGSGENSAGHKVYDFWEYDPSTDTWTRKADTFLGSGGTGFSIGSRGYMGTGYYQNNLLHNFWQYMYAYDPTRDMWRSIADYGGGKISGAVSFNIGSKGYLGTGQLSSVPKKIFYEYDPYKLFTGAISGTTFCSGSTISVPFSSADITFNSGNVFTAQLSDASGSFANPINIGTLTSTATSGTVSATLPSSNIPTGYNYRIRVVSTNTATVGEDNWTNLTIIGSTGIPWSGGISTSPDQSVTLKTVEDGFMYICENSDVHFNIAGASASQYYYYGTLSNTPYFDGSLMHFHMDAGYANFEVTITVNGCVKTLHFVFVSTDCGYGYSYYSLAPNPASSDLTIYVDEEKLKKQKIEKSPDQVIQQVVIMDKLGNVVAQQKYPSDTKKIRLNVSGLAPDIYVAKIFNGKNWTTIKFMKR